MCGSPSRFDATAPIQRLRLAQPSLLTDGGLPSPARALSNRLTPTGDARNG